MFVRENSVLVIGDDSILHKGVFDLIEHEGARHFQNTIFAKNLLQLAYRQPANQKGHYRLAFVCLSQKDFFPVWFSLFIKVNLEAGGNVLLFTDKLELLTLERKRLIERVIGLDYLLHPGLPTAYITHIYETMITQRDRKKMRCNLSAREVTILGGFVNGISSASQARFFGISLKTLYHHRKNCANKLGLHSLKDLLHI